MGLFGNIFDFNHDGKMSSMEKVAEFATFTHIMDEQQKNEKTEELELSGLDMEELEFTDEDERREAIEDAGLDPDDYDF